MGNNISQNKPANPAPPLNAKKNPEIKKEEPVRYRSVYDEIAERRKREKHKIGISSSESREKISFRFGDEVSEIIDEVKQSREEVRQNTEDDDVKVYTPDRHIRENELRSHSESQQADYPVDIYSDDFEEDVYEDEDNYDVPPIPEPPRRIGLWVAIISALSVLCVIAAGAYGMVNGYFDSIISML